MSEDATHQAEARIMGKFNKQNVVLMGIFVVA